MFEAEITVVQAALLSPPFSVLSYRLAPGFSREFWVPGLRLVVPLGRGLRSAVLAGLEAVNPDKLDYPLKELVWPMENRPLLGPDYLEFARQFALRQSQPLGRVLSNMLPAGLRDAGVRLRFMEPGKAGDYDPRRIAELSEFERARLAGLWENGQGRVLRIRESADDEFCRLTISPPWPLRPSAHKQLALLDFLSAHPLVSRRRLLRELGGEFAVVLKKLQDKGLAVLENAAPESVFAKTGRGAAASWISRHSGTLRKPLPFALNAEQKAALDDLENLLDGGESAARLLYGVTGSGKTAIYLEFAAKTLLRGKSVLILAPEVALALKLRQDAQNRFPGLPVRLFHGYQPQAAREACFRDLSASREPALIVGTRSALFLQLGNLGAIILDEEHDSSFKQDGRIHYQAKELAWYLAARSRAVLVLGSATPDLKTFHSAERGLVRMHRLPSRAGGGALPSIRLAVMPKGAGAAGVLIPESRAALKECVEQGHQAVILLNRRGYSPAMFCLACGQTLRCPHCDIALTYHKKKEKMLCHYCGYGTPFPLPCPNCKSLRYLPLGQGTEKLEESLSALLPAGSRVLRLDRDSSARPGSLEEILRSFGRGEAEVLVGTQMLSKGHHFPRVTLAVVADGDLGLSMPDYNSAERTFQLLLQASGRSGRGEIPGKVLIQTRDPGHYCWRYVLTHDYEGFYRHELALRQKYHYPPFCRLGLVRISFPLSSEKGRELLLEAGQLLKKQAAALNVRLLGPAPAPQPRRDGKLRFNCMIKAETWMEIRQCHAAAAHLNARSADFHLTLDLDPASML